MGEVPVPSEHPLLAQPTEQILRHYRGGMRYQVAAPPD
jgi:hypothetical protein